MKRRNKIVQEITQNVANVFSFYAIIAIEHGFQCISICQVPWEVLKTAASGLSFKHLPRDLVNVNACLFVCVEVLWPSQPNGVMSSAVSLPNHMFTGQT